MGCRFWRWTALSALCLLAGIGISLPDLPLSLLKSVKPFDRWRSISVSTSACEDAGAVPVIALSAGNCPKQVCCVGWIDCVGARRRYPSNESGRIRKIILPRVSPRQNGFLKTQVIIGGIVKDWLEIAVFVCFSTRRHIGIVGHKNVGRTAWFRQPHLGILGRKCVCHVAKHRVI
jgi:hypothetical protein